MEIVDIGSRRLVMEIFSNSGHCHDGIIGGFGCADRETDLKKWTMI